MRQPPPIAVAVADALLAVLAVGALVVGVGGDRARHPGPVRAAAPPELRPAAEDAPAPAAPSRATLPHLAPNSISIPVQHVSAPVVGDCAQPDGVLEPPALVSQVCTWGGGTRLTGTAGTTVITGHINWVGQGTGALGRIGDLHAGDRVLTAGASGRATLWRITRVETRSKADPVDEAAFVGTGGPRQLVLITCGGPFDASIASYDDNIYAWAEPVPSVAH